MNNRNTKSLFLNSENDNLSIFSAEKEQATGGGKMRDPGNEVGKSPTKKRRLGV